jgi:hypothetical protein
MYHVVMNHSNLANSNFGLPGVSSLGQDSLDAMWRLQQEKL